MPAEWVHSLITAFAALGGVTLAAWLQQRVSREAYRRAQENLALDLIATMMTVLDDHRSAMWALRNKHHSAHEHQTRTAISALPARLLTRWWLKNKRHAAGGQASCEYLARTHQTRKAISGPLTRLHVIVPSLGAAAEDAANATYAMHHSTDLDDLEVRRLAALNAATQFRSAAVEQFRAAGIGLVLPQDTNYGSRSQ